MLLRFQRVDGILDIEMSLWKASDAKCCVHGDD